MDGLGPYKLDAIHTGDARELLAAVPGESIDLILTDPVYWDVAQYRWLALEAARLLKPGGSLVAQVGQYYLPDVLAAMRVDGLQYVWLIAEKFQGGQHAFYKHRVMNCWKPLVWYARGPRNGAWLMDWVNGGGKDKRYHAWGDSAKMFVGLVARLTAPDSLVLDPFTGGGVVPAACKMLGRRWLAFEIDPETAERARLHVAQTQPPLFVPEPEQLVLSL